VQTKLIAIIGLEEAWKELAPATRQPPEDLQQQVAQLVEATGAIMERHEVLLSGIEGVLCQLGSQLPQLLAETLTVGADLYHSPVKVVSNSTFSTMQSHGFL
jgi:hypothetical protein